MSYKLVNFNGQLASIRRLADGASLPLDSRNRDYAEYLKWVADGGVPEAADPEPAPIDLSDSDQLENVLKALLACIAQVGGLTKEQAKAMFKQKYDNISGQG